MRIRNRKSKATASKPKPPPASRKKAPKGNNTRSLALVPSKAVVEKVCGLTDPFCQAARGAKFPDNSPIRTMPWTLHGRNTFASTSTADSLILWHPQYSYQPWVKPSARVGSAATAWNSFTASSNLPNGVVKYRIVSSGFILRNICAKLTSSGMLHLRSWSVPEGATYVTLDGLAYNSASSMDIATNSAQEICVITQHSTRMPQLYFNVADDSSTVAGFLDNGYTPITIYFDGAPASTDMFDFEFFINFELVFDDSAALGLVATPSNPANSMLTDVAAKITSSSESLVFKGLKAVGDRIYKAAETAIISYVGGPTALAAYRNSRAIAVD